VPVEPQHEALGAARKAQQRVRERLLVEFGEALGAPLVGHHQLDRRAHPRLRGGPRLLARVDEGDGEIGLRPLVGAQKFLDAAMHVLAAGIARQRVGGDADRPLEALQHVERRRRERVAVALREVVLDAVLAREVGEQTRQHGEQHHEQAMVRQDPQAAPARNLHLQPRSRCASSWRIASARKSAARRTRQAAA
jgi:hypothetical protein